MQSVLSAEGLGHTFSVPLVPLLYVSNLCEWCMAFYLAHWAGIHSWLKSWRERLKGGRAGCVVSLPVSYKTAPFVICYVLVLLKNKFGVLRSFVS